MRLQKALLPAVNQNNKKSIISLGKYNKVPFLAYGSANELIIVDMNFQKLQILKISNSLNDLLACVRCSESDGKILVGYNNTLQLLVPSDSTGSFNPPSSECLTWNSAFSIDLGLQVNQVAWSFLNQKFVVSYGNNLSMYILNLEENNTWSYSTIWTIQNSSPCHLIEFTTDDLFIATANFNENFVKVWYSLERAWNNSHSSVLLSEFFHSEMKKILSSEHPFFVYLPHPQPVTNICWRRKSQFYETDFISNFLLTSCQDGIGRVWTENLWDMKALSLISLSTTEAVRHKQDSTKYGISNTLQRLYPYITFHAVTVINPSSYLQSRNLRESPKASEFYWLNNKEIEIATYTNAIFGEYKGMSNENPNITKRSDLESSSQLGTCLGMYNRAITKWHSGPDMVWAISYLDGSFLTWSIDHLDIVGKSQSHSPTSYLVSSITMALHFNLATNIMNCLIYHEADLVANMAERIRRFRTDSSVSVSISQSTSCHSVKDVGMKFHSYPDILLNQNSLIYTTHDDGSINCWKLEYSDHKCFSSVHNVSHFYSSSGPYHAIQSISAHPYLPLVGVATNAYEGRRHPYSSEIFIWRMVPLLCNISQKETWIVQATVRLNDLLVYPDVIWASSPLNYPRMPICFGLVSEHGIGFFQITTLMHDSCLKSSPIEVQELGASVLGARFIGKVYESEGTKYLFVSLESIRLKELNDSSKDKTAEIIYILTAFESSYPNSFVHLWELSFSNTFQTKRFRVSKAHVIDKESASDESYTLNLGFNCRFICKFSLDLGDDLPCKWLSLTNTSFYNPYEIRDGISFACYTKLEEIQILQISVEKNDEFYEANTDICKQFESISLNKKCRVNWKFPYSLFRGLKSTFDYFTRFEKILAFSFSGPYQMACVGVPEDELPPSTAKDLLIIPKTFVVRVFANRLAGRSSWKQEACMCIPFTDFGTQTFNRQYVIKNMENISMSWCSLENGDNILAVVLMSKILIFSQQPQKNIDEHAQNTSYEFRDSSSWTLLSLNSIECDPTLKSVSTWMMGGIFMLGNGRTIDIYVPNESLNFFERPDPFKISFPDLSEVGQALRVSDSRPIISFINLQSLILLGKYSLVSNILFSLYEQLEKALPMIITSDEAASSLNPDDSQSNDYHGMMSQKKEVYFTSPKLYDLLSEYYACRIGKKSSSQHKVQLFSESFEPQVWDSNITQTHTGDKKVLSDLIPLLKKTTITNIHENDTNLIEIIVHVVHEIVSITAKEKELDEMATKYLQAAIFQTQVNAIIPNAQGNEFCQCLCNFHYLCAFHSTTKMELFNIVKKLSSSMTWEVVRSFGFIWWVDDREAMKKLIEEMSKAEFQKTQEPLDAALFHLLLQKRSLVCALFKSKRDTKMSTFFSQDFDQEDAKIAALKNAYHLLSLRRFRHAVVFFLLAKQYWEAIQICVDNLNDPQLGYLVSLHSYSESKDFPTEFIDSYLLNKIDDLYVNNDVFCRSLGYWKKNKPMESLITLVEKPYSCSTSLSLLRKFGISSPEVIIKLHQLLMFDFIRSHINIKKYFSYEKQGLKPTIYHMRCKVTPDYVKYSYERLLFSCIRMSINQGLPLLSMLLFVSRVSELEFEAPSPASPLTDTSHSQISSENRLIVTNALDQSSIDASLHDYWLDREDIKLVSRHLLFASFIRCLIGDIKTDPTNISFNMLHKELRIFKLFCIDFAVEKKLGDDLIGSKLEEIKNFNFNYDSDFKFLINYHYILILLIRHFSLYEMGFAKLTFDLFLIVYELEYLSLKRNFDCYFSIVNPPIVSFQRTNSFVVDIGSAIKCLCQNLLERLFQINPVLFTNPKETEFNDQDRAHFRSVFEVCRFICDLLFRSLGGAKPNFLIQSCLNRHHLLYSLHDNKVFNLLENIEDLVNTLEIKQVSSLWPNVCSSCLSDTDFSPIVRVYEAYLACFTGFLFWAIYEKNAPILNRVLNCQQNLITSWASIFGGSTTVGFDPRSFVNIASNSSFSIPGTIVSEEDPRKYATTSTTVTANKEISTAFDIFISPSMSLFDYFIDMKELKTGDDDSSSVSIYSEENEEKNKYAWSVMTASIFSLQIFNIKRVLKFLNLPSSRIFSYSRIIHSVIVFVNKIRCVLLSKLDDGKNPPDGFLPFVVDLSKSGMADSSASKALLKQFTDEKNTPFQSLYNIPEATLWNKLSQSSQISDEMLLFSYPLAVSDINATSEEKSPVMIYTDVSGLYHFCYDKSNPTIFSIAANSELVELKIVYGSVTNVMELENCRSLSSQSPLRLYLEDVNFLPKTHPNYYDRTTEVSGRHPFTSPVIIKKEISRPCTNTFLVESHPSEPYFISAVGENRISLFQFGVSSSLHEFDFRPKGSSRIVNMAFNQHGNKFGVMEDSGYLNLYLFNTAAHMKPYFHQECHNKFGSGFCFVGSSSIVATCGHSSEGLDVSLWDILMPPRSRLTCSFLSHEHGCSRVAYSSSSHSLIIGGRKGGLSLFDLRAQKILISMPHAHETTITSTVSDSGLIISGSADGIIKTWSLVNSSSKPVELVNTFLPPVSKTRLRDQAIHCLRLYERYLFSSSQQSLTLRVLDRGATS